MSGFILRKARLEDSDFLLDNRNNPEVYKYFHNNKPVARDTHEKWYKSVLTNEKHIIYIVEDNNESIGAVQLKVKDSTGLVSIYISPAYQGNGYALKSLEMLKYRVKHSGLKHLVAEVLVENDSSCRLFEKSGFSKKYITYSYDC